MNINTLFSGTCPKLLPALKIIGEQCNFVAKSLHYSNFYYNNKGENFVLQGPCKSGDCPKNTDLGCYVDKLSQKEIIDMFLNIMEKK